MQPAVQFDVTPLDRLSKSALAPKHPGIPDVVTVDIPKEESTNRSHREMGTCSLPCEGLPLLRGLLRMPEESLEQTHEGIAWEYYAPHSPQRSFHAPPFPIQDSSSSEV